MINITRIDAEQTLDIRQQVLWPDHDQAFCRVAEDATGQHYGGWLDGKLIMVASLFVENKHIRLRKFACLTEHQGKGFGSHMLLHLIALQQSTMLELFWFDARCSAISFYQGLGFSVTSEVFDKHGVDYVKMSKPLP
ncbi:GNAT family N-acetyltransferase [Agarivorans sp. 1_MG-2023]|uniref:GNAT family N-acetyltransferase n=1 Tax=Agarivorans sp. 1_MG-2023 TaxID=3062634 RepID=UPI0026E1B09A|nr:GNAT family N-acetyltransferase [Agarivorans sp. 1_MG-2023]MDO6764348.1 GNAT family N-acetyltransferase [Agarivorans sp. 1_MG-2023]